MQLEELKQALEERKEQFENTVINNRERRLQQIKLAIYAVQEYIKLRVKGLLPDEDVENLIKHLKERFLK